MGSVLGFVMRSIIRTEILFMIAGFWERCRVLGGWTESGFMIKHKTGGAMVFEFLVYKRDSYLFSGVKLNNI